MSIRMLIVTFPCMPRGVPSCRCLIGIGNVRGSESRYEWPLLVSSSTLACYLGLCGYLASRWHAEGRTYQLGLLCGGTLLGPWPCDGHDMVTRWSRGGHAVAT